MGLTPIFTQNTELKEDEDDFKAVYCAIRSSDVKLLKTVISKSYGKKSATRLDRTLSRAFDELRLKNVHMTKEMEFFVQNELVNLRFYSQKKKTPKRKEKLKLDNIDERLVLLLEKISLLCEEYSFTGMDEKFLYVSKFIAQNIHILKQQLKSTYKMVPWEEMEFCLVHFISAHTKCQEINIFSQSILTKDNILNKLNNFSKPLEALKEIIKITDPSVLRQSCDLKREPIINDILNQYPSLRDLYDDYKEIRDVCSFNTIKNYIDMALLAECGTTEGQLTIDRALQVSGEHLKNTLGSPKLSKTSNARLQLLAPKETTEILTDLRTCLSHTHFHGDMEGNELLKSLRYSDIQNDLRKIGTAITEILFSNNIEKISSLLTNIINSDNLDEMYGIFKLNLSDVEEMFNAGQTTNEDRRVEGLIKEICGKVNEKSEYEKEIFNQINEINEIIENLKVVSHDKLKDYSAGCTMLNGMNFLSFNEKSLANRAHNSVTKAMVLKASEIHNFFSTPSDPLKTKKIQKLKKLLIVFYESVEPRIPPEIALELRDLLRIFFNAVFAKDNISETDKFREELNKNTNSVKKKFKEKINASEGINNLDLKLAGLKNILRNPTNKDSALPGSDGNKLMIEMSVLEVMNTLNDLQCLANNVSFLDDSSPVLTGKSLRNHLAHGNPIIDMLFSDNFFAVFANAKNLAKFKFVENCKIGKVETNNIRGLVQKYKRDLHIIDQKKILCNALINGNFNKLKRCLEEGADINSRSINLRTMLHHAAQGPSLEIVKFLLFDKNINANLRDINGQTPLHVASAHRRTSIVQFLIQNTDLKIDEIDNTGKTPLVLACQHDCVDTVEALLTLGANKYVKDFAGWSPLHHAVENNNKNIVKVLLDDDVHIDVIAVSGGFTSLHLAAENGNLQLVQYLLKRKADFNASNSVGETPLHLASFNGHLDVVNVLIEMGADKECKTFDIGCTPICYAVRSNKEKIVRKLLEERANVKVCDKFNQTNLHVASNNGNREIVELLIEYEIDPDAVNCDGETSILCAAKKGYKDIVDLLLIKSNSSVDCTDNNGSTALHLGACNGHRDIIQYFIQNRSIDINAKNAFDQTSLHLAASNGHWKIVEILLAEKADVDAVDANGLTALHLAIISEAFESKNISNYTSPLETAEKNSGETIVNLFIQHKADVDIEDENKNTPLHLASLHGHGEAVKALIKEKKRIGSKRITEYSVALHLAAAGNHKEVVHILFDSGADLSMVNEDNCTALNIAVENNYEDLVNILIEKGADVNVRGKRPLMVAMSEGYRNITERLLKHEDIDIHFEDRVNGTPLHLAAWNGERQLGEILIKKPGAKIDAVHDDHTPLSRAVYQGHKEFVDLLLENGAIVNCKTLHTAIEQGYTDIVESLLHRKTKNIIKNGTLTYDYINVNEKGDNTFSLLHIAAKEGNLYIVKYLVERGADVAAKTILGTKPIQTAAFFGHVDIVDFFLENGSRIGDTGEDGGSLLYYAAEGGQTEVAQYLIEKNVDVNYLDEDGMQPIHAAAQFGHLEVTKVLLDSGSIYNGKDNFGRKPSDWTTSNDISKLLTSVDSLYKAVRLDNIKLVENLINDGIPVNAKRGDGSTLLHFAAWKDSPRACDALLKINADPNAVTKDGDTPLHYAAKYARLKIVKSLLANGAIYNYTADNNKKPSDYATKESVKDLLKLVEESFRKIKNSDTTVINDLTKIEDVNTVKAVMRACNKDQDTLIVVAINNDFPQIEKLVEFVNIFRDD